MYNKENCQHYHYHCDLYYYPSYCIHSNYHLLLIHLDLYVIKLTFENCFNDDEQLPRLEVNATYSSTVSFNPGCVPVTRGAHLSKLKVAYICT